jgi:CreA protein
MLKKIKWFFIITLSLLVLAFILRLVLKDDVGNVSLGMFTTNDIKLNMMTDPIVVGVTCHVASIESDLSFSDPSDSSISCRQTGEITAAMIAQINKSKSGEVVFKKSKSIFFKNMKIRRIFDAKNQTLMYVSYSTKETSGSYKHSLSTVPLWGSKAYITPQLNN